MIGELIPTGVTFGAGRNSINDAFSGNAEFNNIVLDSGADFSGGTGGGVIYSAGTDLYNVFLTSATDATTASNGLTKSGDNISLGGTLTASTEINLSGFNFTLLGGNLGINTTPVTSLDVSGMTSLRGQVGSDTLSPHLEIYHNTQVQPVAQYQHWSSDNISISNGLYWDSGSWRNSDTGSNFQIYKWADAFRFNYGAGGTLGASATIGGGFALTNTGDLKIGGFTQLGTITATEKVDIDGNIIVRGTANITGDTMLASSGGTIYSAGTDLYNIFSNVDYVIGNFIPLSGTSTNVSGNIDFDDDIELSWNGGGESITYDSGSGALAINTSDGVDFETGVIYSAGTDLYSIFSTGGGGDVTRVQPGTNITTGGTANNPTINLSDNITLSSITASTLVVTGNTTLYSTEKIRRKTVNDFGTTSGLIDWDMDAVGSNTKVTLSGNMSLNIINAQSGDFGTMRIRQDGAGSHTMSFASGTNKVANGGGGSITLTSTAGAVDIITFFYDGSEFNWNVGNDYT